MKKIFQCKRSAGWLLVALFAMSVGIQANEVPVRLSVKFILNSSGNRPPTGEFNTDAEINAQIDTANEIYKAMGSEFKHTVTEILEVSGASGYYTADTDDRDAIRNSAMANPAQYHWRNNAVNVYITSANASAIADFPPDNNIVIMCQSIFDTTLGHEIGHIMNLKHTHQLPTDNCADTLPDDEDWTRDQIAQNSYSLNYSQLNASQQQLVDNTWGNLMSYHSGDNRYLVTADQADRESAQGYADRSWLLSKTPVYVRVGASTLPFIDMGSWSFPYPTVQAAMDAGEVNNRALVLLAGTHADPTGVIDTNTDLIPRRGNARLQCKKPDYDLPYNVEDSTNSTVAAAVVRAQNLTREGDADGALAALKEAAALAKGRERHVLELEIAQRLRDSGQFEESETYFNKVAQETEQPGLKKRSEMKSGRMAVKKLKRIKQEKTLKGGANDNGHNDGEIQ